MLSFIPIMEGMHRVWQMLSRNFGVPRVCWNPLGLSPLLLNAVAKPAPTAPRTGRKFHISTGRACEHGWDVGRGWEHHPDSYLLLDPVAEVFLDEFAAGGGAEGQVSLQRLWGG